MDLKAENISFSYNKKRQILKDVSLSLNSNKIIGLIGDSGSGKSTLCKILSGYITNYSGEVTLDGNKISDKNFHPVQLIFQHPEKTMNPKWKMEKVLKESWQPPQSLNPKTKFIIADEISTMLDALTQVQIWEALISHAKANSIGILAVSHDEELLEVICDDILHFNEINGV